MEVREKTPPRMRLTRTSTKSCGRQSLTRTARSEKEEEGQERAEERGTQKCPHRERFGEAGSPNYELGSIHDFEVCC